MSKSLVMSVVDRNVDLSVRVSAGVVNHIVRTLQVYLIENCIFNIDVTKSLPKDHYFNQLYLWSYIRRHGLNILCGKYPQSPTPFNGFITETNCVEIDGVLNFYDGSGWYHRKSKNNLLPPFHRTGLRPDIIFRNKITNRFFYDEIKSQQNAGNAHERSNKYLTEATINLVKELEDIDYYPFGMVITGEMSRDINYVLEFEHNYSPYPGHLLVWNDESDVQPVIDRFENVIRPLIDKK